MFTIPKRPLLVLGALIVLAGCAGGPPRTDVTPTPTNAEFLAMDAAQRNATLAAINTEGTEVARLNETLYRNNRPVSYSDGRTSYTIQWVRTPVPGSQGLINIYPGNSTGAMGQDVAAIMVLGANAHGQWDGRVLAASSSFQEGLGRFMLRGGFAVLGAAANGAIAAQIHADARCRSNCGTVINATAYSGSEATATGTGTATVNGGGFHNPYD